MFSHAHPSGGRRTAGRFGTPVGGLALIALSASAVVSMARDPKPMTVALERQPGRVVVRIGGQPFTEYVFEGHAKPILFPILGPGGVPMTRSWPIVKDVPDEPHDHPHHESLWFTHGKVNGLDFWAHKADKEGRRPSVRQVAVTTSDEQGSIESRNEWVRQDGAVVMTDTRRIGFWGDADASATRATGTPATTASSRRTRSACTISPAPRPTPATAPFPKAARCGCGTGSCSTTAMRPRPTSIDAGGSGRVGSGSRSGLPTPRRRTFATGLMALAFSAADAPIPLSPWERAG
jgi:hypothetical protein